MIKWYDEVLGLKEGLRPDFKIPGAWLYAGDVVVVHLIETTEPPEAGSAHDLQLEHFAFTATGAVEFEDRLQELQLPYERYLPRVTTTAIYDLWDPDNNHVHVDFPVDELPPTRV